MNVSSTASFLMNISYSSSTAIWNPEGTVEVIIPDWLIFLFAAFIMLVFLFAFIPICIVTQVTSKAEISIKKQSLHEQKPLVDERPRQQNNDVNLDITVTSSSSATNENEL